MARTILFTGGCRSGKSRLAQAWVESMAPTRAYVATSRPGTDPEMRERVRRHQADRGPGWSTVEPDDCSPDTVLDAVAAIRRGAEQAGAVLFDCVTLWTGERLWQAQDAEFSATEARIVSEAALLADFLRQCPVPVALVTNEVGYGLVPETPLGRQFRDVVGLVNQRLAAACEGVVLAVCGQPLIVKGEVRMPSSTSMV